MNIETAVNGQGGRVELRKPRILFASVFGPYALDDEYGSRAINPMELYHNQVTRMQGPFSSRMFHRSWGLMLLRENISVPSALLDFPTRDRFIQEIQTKAYDVFAISAIPPNVLKVEEMCRLIRQHQPLAEIIVGGHISGMPGIKERLGADHVVRGDGVRWLRRFLGEDEEAPIQGQELVFVCLHLCECADVLHDGAACGFRHLLGVDGARR